MKVPPGISGLMMYEPGKGNGSFIQFLNRANLAMIPGQRKVTQAQEVVTPGGD
jgi:hypothetical protein